MLGKASISCYMPRDAFAKEGCKRCSHALFNFVGQEACYWNCQRSCDTQQWCHMAPWLSFRVMLWRPMSAMSSQVSCGCPEKRCHFFYVPGQLGLMVYTDHLYSLERKPRIMLHNLPRYHLPWQSSFKSSKSHCTSRYLVRLRGSVDPANFVKTSSGASPSLGEDFELCSLSSLQALKVWRLASDGLY